MASRPAFFDDLWRIESALAGRGSGPRTQPPNTLEQVSWHDFERGLGDAFRRRGFTLTGFGKNGADGSADFGLKKDGGRYLVHCRQWRKITVGVTAVRELSAAIAAVGACGGYVVTGGQFTREARQLADSCRITLLDGGVLQRLMGARSAA